MCNLETHHITETDHVLVWCTALLDPTLLSETTTIHNTSTKACITVFVGISIHIIYEWCMRAKSTVLGTFMLCGRAYLRGADAVVITNFLTSDVLS